ncbi:prepilin-type N-terminal cleavage/methylation domain-containing protein [uncultured Gemmiger sp.]|uniref:prepilin-type N-terminal cleavage/methylation domain-containing protein n=1 Tax=uncultured Gemmiger sp. TaxID=1623490 RepID=UPI0027DD11ED|nr:prepilin-type N-terminal cleavage/methylation domain-containing protein [uncultured Gemmiger sp.]
MKYCYFKTRNRRGFTLVELMVVLAVTAILAALAGGGLLAYIRLARFQKNESNARAMFQTAQLATAQMELAGEKDDFTAQVAANGHGGHITQPLTETMKPEECEALNARVYALYFDKGVEPTPDTPEGKLYAYIKQYVYDSSFLDAAFCIEIDASTGQVFSVFYDSGVQALRFANNQNGTTNATLLDDRSYQNRRDRTLVGYYCADDAVNVVNLQQSKLRVRNQRLINGETLDLTWGGTSKSNETDTQYTVDICSKTTKKKLFSVLVTLPTVTETQKELPVTLYDEHGSETTTDNYFFPLRYANGSFVLTLDAMNDAAILQAHSDPVKGAGIDKTEFFSITRFVKDATDIYATITAAPRAESVTSYTVSEGAETNTENSLYAKGGATAELQCFRHLYNLRWYKGENALTATLTKNIDWLSGAPVVYCAEGKSAAAKTPAADAPVAWPSLLELKKNVTLNGNNKTITGLQLRGNSVAENGCRYIGLVAENSGTIQDLTLADPDVLVNLTAAENGTGATATYTVGGEALALMATDAEGYRENVRAVGALCGVSTGTVENCTVKRSKNRTATARVAASLTFNDQTTTYTRQKSADGKTIENEPLGIGGLVGSAVPGNGKTLKDLTVDKNVTVAGIWQDGGTNKATAAAANETTERTRITATDIDRAIGVGGVFGVLSLQESCTVDTLNNSAEVCGNAYTGGVAGNLCGKSAGETIATNLNNTGSVQALAGYQGYTAGESRVLGQFFGGVAGRMKNAKLTKSYSSTRSSLSENDIKTLIVNGYNPNGTLSAASPLQGDFVGGLVGFGEGVKISHCQTGSGYVLGNTFVGGVVGGLSSGTVLSDGTANSSHVFGHRYVGGVVSFNGSGSTITGMSNTGMTAAFGTNAAYAGGIVGYNEGTLENCTAAASTNTATNASRVQLLQAMAKGYYADFVGGVAGCNAGTITWTHDAAVSTLLHGGSFVGGVVGFNDAGAAITVADSAALTVSGRIAGVQDAVGGLAGLNCGTALPAVTVKAELVSGRYCVGGVLGANVVTTNMTATGLCTDGSGNSLQAQALAGGIVGYNQVIAAMPAPAENNTITRAKLLLPVVSNTSGILTVTGQNTEGTATVTLNNCTNALNLTADAYVGGVVGWGEHLALNDAQNGALHSVSKGVLHSSGSLQAQPAPSADAVTGNAAGGIIGYAGGSTKLNGCQNFAGVFHKQMAGGIAGYNAGIIKDCTQSANLGTRQTGYTYIGGIAGVNAGSIQASAPKNVTISGEQFVGGVAGLNAQNSTIENITNCIVTVQGSQVVGGLAGKNNGTVKNSTSLTVNVAASGINAGGAVGQNSGTVQSVTVTGGSVQGSDAVGGLAGENLGRVESCKTEATLTVRANQNAGAAVGSNAENAVVSAGNYAGTVYAASSNAGGIAGQNAGSIADNATVSATVTCENGDAGGVAALNSESGTISAVQVKDCTVNSGSAYMGAVAAVNNGTIQGVTVQSAALQGDATVIGGIAGLNKGTIGTETCTVQNALTLEKLTAADITLGGAAGQNEKDATINNVQVALNVTKKLAQYRTLGGVAGVNNGTLQNCTFTAGQLGEDVKADAPAATGAAKVRDAIGGVAGVNNRDAKVENCTVQKIRINVLGITNVESSQDVETKLNNASHVGGIVGRNSGTIEKSIIGTDENSAVIAKFGFVGGVAGSNAGEISGCGGKGTADAVSQIQTWLGTDGDVNTMITQLKYSQDDDNESETDSADKAFTALRGVDAVRAGDDYTTVYTENGLAKNQLTVALRGSATISTEEAAGYLGGVTGYNTDTGVLHDTATGKWFVYCDNGNVDNAVIGGMIGQNESDKDMTNLLNCAAVRRFNRTENGTDGNDDTQNSEIKNNISKQHVANANVGGVIGVQQNRSGDRWSLTNVVNYGMVHNSRSNNLAGIICLWVDNGGTLEHCFNFGTMRANSNGGGGSGTMGGIVALFDKPVAGGTTNLVSCQNHGDMLWENETKQKTANDVGGILGKIQMKNPSDYLVVNITDCVNGSIKMQSNSLCVGIMAWLGPEGTIENAEVNIDRCRNYCLDATSEGGAGAAVGIYGNRGSGGVTRAATTITNCFVLNAGDNSDSAIMRPYSGYVKETIHLDPEQPNLYMDKNSFAVSTAGNAYATPIALETLQEGEVYDSGYNTPAYGTDRSNKTYFDSIIPGYRLYAGKNTTDGNYFAALITGMGAGGGHTLENIHGGNSYIQDNTIVSSDEANNTLADILFPFGESGKADDTQKYSSSRPDMSDITDTAVQAYYKDVLDKQYDMENAEVTNIIAVLSDATGDGAPIYGRYRVTWKAVTGASHYKVTVKVQDENGVYTEMPEILPTATVYTNQYTFEAPKEWAGKKYIVEVKPCNSKEGTATSSDTNNPFIFAKTLPTPQMEVRVFETGITLYMKNIDDYDNAQIDEDWAVTPSMIGGGWNWSVSYDKNHFETQANRGKGYIGDFSIKNTERTFSLRASAKTKQPSNQWMQSDQYNVQTYMPKDNFVGLGKLTMTDPVLTGTTADALTIATDLSISGQTYNPKYRIMLQGRCQKDITVDGENLNGQYVTLQAVETVLSGSPTRVTFTNLPAYALTDYSAWRILAAPVNTGMGDTTCRWQYQQENNPYPCGREYVREADGNYTEYSMSTLYNISGYACTVAKDITLTVLPAPALNEDATWEWDDQNNLLYTFTWNNAENAADYTYKLYGETENGEVEINLPTGAAKLETVGTQTKLTVAVDKLANGAADWHFATVRLAVTSVPAKDSTNTVGATASREYTGIRTRLTQPGAPNSILLTNNADAETLPYKITWTGIADDALDHYQLLAEYKDSSDSWQTAETWQGTKDASLTVNLEKYQGKTLHLRVVAVPADESGAVLRSPYSVTSNEFTVVTRETAPTVTEVKFTNTTPTQDEFLNRLQVQFTVKDSASHYVTGYLFKDKTDYDAVVELVTAWNKADADGKAAALKAMQEKLETLLQDGNKAVCLIPQESRTTGVQAETTGNTVRYTLTPDKFAMQPQYGDWYLLPAVRTMTTEEGKACSVWTYYTTALQVPCIRLDTPLAVRSTSTYTGAAIISDTPNATSGADATLEVQRIAVQWSADNLYPAADGDIMLADTYEVKVTPTENNGDPYTLRITVQPKDEYEQDENGNKLLDENGNPVVKTARGAVLKVEKIVDESTSFELKPNDGGSWYLDTTQATDENGNPTTKEHPTTLTGTILQEGNLLRYYTMQVRPMLQYDAAAKTYHLILPDLAQAVYADPSDPTSSGLTAYTATVAITAKGANVQPSQPATIDPQQTN